MRVWLPSTIYKIKPLAFIFAAIVLMLTIPNTFVLIIALALVCYSIWIYVMRFMWKDTGIVN